MALLQYKAYKSKAAKEEAAVRIPPPRQTAQPDVERAAAASMAAFDDGTFRAATEAHRPDGDSASSGSTCASRNDSIWAQPNDSGPNSSFKAKLDQAFAKPPARRSCWRASSGPGRTTRSPAA